MILISENFVIISNKMLTGNILVATIIKEITILIESHNISSMT